MVQTKHRKKYMTEITKTLSRLIQVICGKKIHCNGLHGWWQCPSQAGG